MTEHASDCALHNAPAMAPEACTCGASRVFRVWGYDISNDTFAWRPFCRETAVAHVASSSLARLYSAEGKGWVSRAVRISVLILRAFACGLTPNEVAAIRAGWGEFWPEYTPEHLARIGHASAYSDQNGAYLTLEELGDLTAEPTMEEFAAAVALWTPYWQTLPEPVQVGAVRLAA